MSPELLDLLRRVDTPTVCNAIETVQGRRGFDRFTRGTMLASHPGAPALVGQAVTAVIAARFPPVESPAVIRARRMDYYRAMAEAPRPAIAVVQDADHPDAVGAYWGEVNTRIHKALGLAGALTNGVMRDLGDLPEGFPVIAGSIGVSHGFVHVRGVNVPVTVFGLHVAPGDWVHADRHGALVIPPEVIPDLARGIERLFAAERIIIEPTKQDGFDFAAFEAAWAAFERART